MNQSKIEVLRQKNKLKDMGSPVTTTIHPELKTWNFYESTMWKNKRLQMLKKRKFKCELCGSKGQLHVHHKKYKMFKPLTYLQVLCPICHAKQHKINGELILKKAVV